MRNDEKKPKFDEATGLLERTVNIEDIMEAKKIPEWGKPKGSDLFNRINESVEYFQRQQKQ